VVWLSYTGSSAAIRWAGGSWDPDPATLWFFPILCTWHWASGKFYLRWRIPLRSCWGGCRCEFLRGGDTERTVILGRPPAGSILVRAWVICRFLLRLTWFPRTLPPHWLHLPGNRWFVRYELSVGEKIEFNCFGIVHYLLHLGSFLSLYTFLCVSYVMYQVDLNPCWHCSFLVLIFYFGAQYVDCFFLCFFLVLVELKLR
jgi:hypothetical protein